jgi:hypothetical protein
MEKIIAIQFLKFICKKCSRLQDNIVIYKDIYYVTYGKPFDDVRSTDDLFELFLKEA